MEQMILHKLREIEKTENVHILLAVESGSRAWGFASSDSDYDVRFIYVRPKEAYLRLDKTRDVIELPIDNMLDINGWDFRKTLQLLHQSNPTVFEWFSSPIIYIETEFAHKFKHMMQDYFSAKKSLYHYLSMAKKDYATHLNHDMVKIKKYFYALRPVLACLWILDYGTPPPMPFSELMKAELPEALYTEVRKLLALKRNSPEIQEIARVNQINTYLESSMNEIKEILQNLQETRHADWQKLNDVFLRAL